MNYLICIVFIITPLRRGSLNQDLSLSQSMIRDALIIHPLQNFGLNKKLLRKSKIKETIPGGFR